MQLFRDVCGSGTVLYPATLYMFDLLITEAGLANITVSKACVARRAVLSKKFGSLQGQAYYESMAR